MKYKVGDRVRIRNDLELNVNYNGADLIPEMEKYRGELLIIQDVKEINGRTFYKMMNTPNICYWTGEMIEGLADDVPDHMTAEEIVTWFKYLYETDDVYGAFENMPDGYGISDLFERYSPREIVEKIEAYEAKQKAEQAEKPAVKGVAQMFTVTFRDEPIDDRLWTPNTPTVWTRFVTEYSDGATTCTEPQKMLFAKRGGWTD